MLRALTTAATGLEAQQSNIERISTDLANVNTDGYKRSRNEFHDLMYQTIKEPGQALGAATQSPVGIQVGTGVKVAATHKNFEQGPAKVTSYPYDLMIEGRGFFPVQMPNGEVAYSRSGAFHRDAQGRIMMTSGAVLLPQITVPPNAVNFGVSNRGEVKATLADMSEVNLGQLQLVNFTNEQGLVSAGMGLYKPSAASGPPLQGIPGENGVGTLQQGALEASNVNIANSMVEMITAQRAYEMGTRTMKVADEMLGATSNLK